MASALVSGPALATDAIAVAIALARRAELTTVFTDMRFLRMGSKVVPGLDTTAIRITREICYTVAIRADHSLSERFCSVSGNVPPSKTHMLSITLALESGTTRGSSSQVQSGWTRWSMSSLAALVN